jgi:hypothetical protein
VTLNTNIYKLFKPEYFKMAFHTIADYGNHIMRRLEGMQTGGAIPLSAELITEEARDSTGDFSVFCRYYDGEYAFKHQLASGYSRGDKIESGELERGLLSLVREILPHKIIVSRLGRKTKMVDGQIEKGSCVDYIGVEDKDTPRLIVKNPEISEVSSAKIVVPQSDSQPVQMVFDL